VYDVPNHVAVSTKAAPCGGVARTTVPLTAVGLGVAAPRQSCGFNQQHCEPALQFPVATEVGRVTQLAHASAAAQQAAEHASVVDTSRVV
jgi:hypothetical protein